MLRLGSSDQGRGLPKGLAAQERPAPPKSHTLCSALVASEQISLPALSPAKLNSRYVPSGLEPVPNHGPPCPENLAASVGRRLRRLGSCPGTRHLRARSRSFVLPKAGDVRDTVKGWPREAPSPGVSDPRARTGPKAEQQEARGSLRQEKPEGRLRGPRCGDLLPAGWDTAPPGVTPADQAHFRVVSCTQPLCSFYF